MALATLSDLVFHVREISSGHAELDSIAVRGARNLRYDPATEGEQPVAVWAMLPVRFTRSTAAESTEGR